MDLSQQSDDQKDEFIPKRCKKEKGRNLCLYSTTEYTPKKQSDSLFITISDVNIDEIKKKYFTNMYMLSKWSKFIRELYLNDTLEKFCNKLDDGTYILGIPASSKAIENVVLAINLEDDEIISPHQGSVKWVGFSNVIDAMDVANFLQIQDILSQSLQVIQKMFPGKVGSTSSSKYQCYLAQSSYTERDNRYYSSQEVASYERAWHIGIPVILKLKKSKKASYMAAYLLALISYFQNQSFDWSQKIPSTKTLIESLLMAFLSIDVKLVSIKKKLALFNQYVKPGDEAHQMFCQLTLMTFGNNAPTTLS